MKDRYLFIAINIDRENAIIADDIWHRPASRDWSNIINYQSSRLAICLSLLYFERLSNGSFGKSLKITVNALKWAVVRTQKDVTALEFISVSSCGHRLLSDFPHWVASDPLLGPLFFISLENSAAFSPSSGQLSAHKCLSFNNLTHEKSVSRLRTCWSKLERNWHSEW